MGVLDRLIPGRRRGDAHGIYLKIVAQARLPAFYGDFGVPDTVGGRFDMIALHAYVVMRRLKESGETGTRLSQRIFDTMFADLDRNLREMGVGDLSVGRRVKDLAKSFYGRIKAYDDGLAGTEQDLEQALARNLYADSSASAGHLTAMAGYLRDAIAKSRHWPFDSVARAEITFPVPSFEG